MHKHTERVYAPTHSAGFLPTFFPQIINNQFLPKIGEKQRFQGNFGCFLPQKTGMADIHHRKSLPYNELHNDVICNAQR